MYDRFPRGENRMDEEAGIDVDADRRAQEKYWKFQRIAWLVMAGTVAGAVLGATGGGGMLSRATAKNALGEIDYPRIARWQAANEMTLRLPGGASREADLELDGTFARLFSIEEVVPSPSRSAATPSGHRFTFSLGQGPEERTIIFRLKPGRPAGPTRASARIEGGPPIVLSFVILP